MNFLLFKIVNSLYLSNFEIIYMMKLDFMAKTDKNSENLITKVKVTDKKVKEKTEKTPAKKAKKIAEIAVEVKSSVEAQTKAVKKAAKKDTKEKVTKLNEAKKAPVKVTVSDEKPVKESNSSVKSNKKVKAVSKKDTSKADKNISKEVKEEQTKKTISKEEKVAKKKDPSEKKKESSKTIKKVVEKPADLRKVNESNSTKNVNAKSNKIVVEEKNEKAEKSLKKAIAKTKTQEQSKTIKTNNTAPVKPNVKVAESKIIENNKAPQEPNKASENVAKSNKIQNNKNDNKKSIKNVKNAEITPAKIDNNTPVVKTIESGKKELKLILKSELDKIELNKPKQEEVKSESKELTNQVKQQEKTLNPENKNILNNKNVKPNINNKVNNTLKDKDLKSSPNIAKQNENNNINNINNNKQVKPEKKVEIQKKEEKINIEEYFKSGAYIIKSKNDKANTKPKEIIKNKEKNKKEVKDNKLKINQSMLLTQSQKRDNYFKKIYSEVEEFIDKELYLDEKINIVVGVSGGVDSVVLFDILANISQKKEFNLIVAHVDHSLRKESETDMEFVKKLCEKYNVKFYSKKINVKEHSNKKKISIEEAARELRYDFMEEVCAKTNSSFLALAHNANDSAETFFINLLRGTGLSGLSGIPQKRPLNTQVNIIRPIINLSRADIEEYAKKRNIKWVEDISNKENIYLRNKIRNELLPFIQEKFDRDIISSINKASKLINSADVFIYHKIKKYVNDVLIEKKTSYVEIDLKKLFLFDDFIKGEILNLILKNIFEIKNISQNIVKGILGLEYSEPGAVFEINSKITAYKDRQTLFIARNQLFRNNSLVIEKIGEFKFENKVFKLSKIPKNKIEFGEASNIEYFDLDYLPEKLEIRHIQDGDKFTPIGMTGRVKLSDFLVNNKIPLLKKKDILVLTDRVNIIWVCGLRIADKYKITQNTKKVLKVEMIDKNN